MKIYRGIEELIEVDPQGSSTYVEQVMGEHKITLVFELSECFELRIGDYVVESGINYRLNQLPTIKKLSKKLFQYNAVFEPPKYDLLKRIFLLFDNTGAAIQGEFSMPGNALDFMTLLVANMNRGSSGWLVGDVLDTEYVTLTFSNETCMAVLERLASELDTEYHVVNKTLHLQNKSTARELTLEYGESAYDIERLSVNTADVVTRLYAFGSDKNLSATYGGGSKRLLMPDGVPYIDSPNISLYGIIEASKNFDDIYPRLSSTGAGTVTSVGDKFTFTDTAIDFDINEHLLNQVPPKVRFLTGQCAGYDFEVRSYNKLTQTFVILENRTESDLPLPSDLLKPAPTDKYTLLDIAMPTDYVLAAEAELDAKAVEYLYEFHNPRVQYRVKFSELFAKLELPVMQCGDQVRIIDTDLGIDTLIRINKLQRGIRNKYDIQIELDKTVTKTKLETITEELNNFNNEVIVNNITSRSRWIEAYQRAKEIKELVFDPDGYFDTGNIRPGSIETGMIAVGSRSQQFQTTCVLQPNWGGNPQYFYWSAGLLTHFTIKNDGTAQDWTIGAGSYIIGGDDQTRPLYIYARCSRTGSTGDIYLNAAPFRFDSNLTHWLFLVGILHSPIAGVRGISLSNGQTLISGQWVTTGVISSIDGLTKFDLNNGIISGNIQFLSGGTLKSIDQILSQAQSETYGYIDGIKADLQSQIDGNITSWFYDYIPTLSNLPASGWSALEKANHLGDLFYDTSTGYAYRFQFTGGVYSWARITDTDVVKALADAAQAQDTADQKRRVFGVTPYPPYDAGDLWVQGAEGDIFRCIFPRTTGSFVPSDWEKASKYTDDSAVYDLEIGGENFYTDTTLLSVSSFGGSTPTIARNADNGFDIVTSSGGVLTEARISNVVKENGYHVVTCLIKVASGSAEINIDICYTSAVSVTANTEWQKVQGVVNVANQSDAIYNFVDFQTSVYCEIHVKDFMVQRGNKPTGYKKATDFLTQAMSGSTDVYGGLLMTNVLLMKAMSGIVAGGMSGLTADKVGMWAGGLYQDAIADADRPFKSAMATGALDKKDGSGHRAFGKIAWDTLGNTFFAGIVEALAGAKIGRFSVFEDTLRSDSMSFSETPVESLASLMSPSSVSITQVSSWTNAAENEAAIATSQNIVLPYDATLKFRATCTPGIENPYPRVWRVQVLDLAENVVYTSEGYGQITNQLFTVNLPAGIYYIKALAQLSAPPWVDTYNTASITGELITIIYAYSYAAQTKIGSDGFYSFWNSERYIYFKSDYGFEGRFGLIGLRFIVGQSSPQKMVGGTWSNL
ncbi:MAG: hypothetical protein RBT57_02870 [Paludibacter sp.]|jgi:hypothetical protein|nr:hypothetical protein [Paludibacter sp.]